MSTYAYSIYMHIYTQDTVPVDPESEEEWIHQPFSGYLDGKPPLCFDHVKASSLFSTLILGEWIWGRGAVDGKSTLNAIL